jgi:hypothetical protein
MREIKFRIWDSKEEMMIQDSGHFHVSADGEVFSINDNEDITNSVVLMQYTGLKDKNGKEIYEGDIVLLDLGVFGAVYYDEAETSYIVHVQPLGPRQEHQYEVLGLGYPESVIGNIHENSELIREDENICK